MTRFRNHQINLPLLLLAFGTSHIPSQRRREEVSAEAYVTIVSLLLETMAIFSVISSPSSLLFLVCAGGTGGRSFTLTTDAFSVRTSDWVGLRSRSTTRSSSSSSFTELFSAPPKKEPVTAATTTTTTTTAYPTARGSEVDARKIVAAGRQHIQALLVAHCLFATQDLAEESLLRLRMAQVDFETLASTVSACGETRDDKGLVGWVNLHHHHADDSSSSSSISSNEHLDGILPVEARDTLARMVTKPGDVVMLQSWRGYHLVQIADLMADVTSMATFKKTRKRNHQASMENLTYKIETMGCQMNLADSERIEGQLLNLGIRPHDAGPKDKDPDVVVLNTCSIRDHAEQKVYSYMGPHVKRKRDGDNNVTLIVAGCVAQQEGENLLRRAPEIDLVMGPQYSNRLGDLLFDVRVNGNQVVATAATHIMEDSTKPRRESKVCAWTNIIYGCNERCAFCIVPTTRGVEQSRPEASIVKEVTELVREGYKEITLLGQNIDAYGRDMQPKRKFSDLIRTVGSISGLERLRFVTSHPRYMSMGVVDAVAETEAACECFHIPFQSGSNQILSTMGRGHTREKYLRIVERIRKVRFSLLVAVCSLFCRGLHSYLLFLLQSFHKENTGRSHYS